MTYIRHIGDDYMDQPPRQRHAINRTSPKGHSFVGTCALCGKPGLTLGDMNTECENTRGLTQDEALIEAIVGPPVPSREQATGVIASVGSATGERT